MAAVAASAVAVAGIEAVVMGMMDVPEMRRLFRVQPFDFWIAIGRHRRGLAGVCSPG